MDVIQIQRMQKVVWNEVCIGGKWYMAIQNKERMKNDK